MQSRIDELLAANDDIKNLLDATEIATIFLDINLNVRRFTPKVVELFHLTSSDIGRPIEHFATTLKDLKVVDYAKEVLKDLAMQELELEDNHGKSFHMQMRPYRTLNNVIDGVVVSFNDVTEQRNISRESHENEEKWRSLAEHIPMAIVLEQEGCMAYVNPFAMKLFNVSSPEVLLGTRFMDRVHPDDHELVSKRIEILYSNNTPSLAIEERWLQMDDSELKVLVSTTPTVINGKRGALIFARELSMSEERYSEAG